METVEQVRERLKKTSNHQPNMERYVTFSVGYDKNGNQVPNEQKRKQLSEKLEPIRHTLETEITNLIKKASKENAVHILMDYDGDIAIKFVYSDSLSKD